MSAHDLNPGLRRIVIDEFHLHEQPARQPRNGDDRSIPEWVIRVLFQILGPRLLTDGGTIPALYELAKQAADALSSGVSPARSRSDRTRAAAESFH
jgi:hypothetical protein